MERYESYKDSGVEWIGEIPEGWELLRVKSVAKISNGSDPTTQGDVPVYGSGGEPFKTCGEYKEGPAVLLGRKGTVSNPHFVTGRYWNVDTAFDVRTNDKMDIRFFFYSSMLFDYDLFLSSTALPSMTQRDYGMMKIPVPSIETQTWVVSYLDSKTSEVDGYIADTERSIDLLAEYRHAVISEAVTKGLDPDVPMRDSGIEWMGSIPEGWGLSKIGRVAYCLNGDRGANYPSGTDMVDDGVAFIPTDALHGDFVLPEACKFITRDKYNSLSGVKLQLSDIVYCLRGSVGLCSINCSFSEGTVASSLMAVRPYACSYKWLYYLLCSEVAQYQVSLRMNGTCAANLSAANVCDFRIPLPDDAVQKDISNYLDAKTAEIDSLVADKRRLVERLREYRASLVSEAVTGKFKVPGVA